MLRISKLTDYGTVVLACLAASPDGHQTASQVAERTRLAGPTVSKLLKSLHRAGLVTSARGCSRRISAGAGRRIRISAASIIDAIEGPVAITECSGNHSACDIESVCRTGNAWQRINGAIRRSLDDITLAQLAGQEAVAIWRPGAGGRRPPRPCRPARADEPEETAVSTDTKNLDAIVGQKYRHGFVTDIESDTVPPGLDEDVIRLISRKKAEPQFMLDWRLKAFRHWLTMREPDWAQRARRADRLPGDLVLLGAEEPAGRSEEPRRTSTRSCWRPTRSSACRCTSAHGSRALRSTPCSTASRSRRRSRTGWPRPA